MTYQDVWAAFVAFFLGARLDVILALVLIDVVLAVAVALRTKTFELKRLGDFLTTMILPYVLAYLVLDIAVGLVPTLNGVLGQGINLLVFGVIVASLAGAIFENIKALGMGITQPVTQAGSLGPAGPGTTSSGNDNPVG